MVYVLAQLGFEYGSEARRDAFHARIGLDKNVNDPKEIVAHLKTDPWDAASIIWTLRFDQTVVYSIRPTGPYASDVCNRLRDLLEGQENGTVGIVSVPGTINGEDRLLNGHAVPSIDPEMRGLYGWTPQTLIKRVAGEVKGNASQKVKQAHKEKVEGIAGFLDRIYYELRNLGRSPEQRAINFAATNAIDIERIYDKAQKENMDLDTIEVERSPICRPESDCWDVKLHFFYPERQVQTVRRVHRFTIDVSDVVPVKIGKVRSWYVRQDVNLFLLSYGVHLCFHTSPPPSNGQDPPLQPAK